MSEIRVEERDLTILAIAGGMLIASLALLTTVLVIFIGQAHKVDVVYNAQCTYRQNLQQQVIDTEHYLALHPMGAPAIGLSVANINSTLAREKAAVDSLAGLNCPQQGG